VTKQNESAQERKIKKSKSHTDVGLDGDGTFFSLSEREVLNTQGVPTEHQRWREQRPVTMKNGAKNCKVAARVDHRCLRSETKGRVSERGHKTGGREG
jgi:hypothetical protein